MSGEQIMEMARVAVRQAEHRSGDEIMSDDLRGQLMIMISETLLDMREATFNDALEMLRLAK